MLDKTDSVGRPVMLQLISLINMAASSSDECLSTFYEIFKSVIHPYLWNLHSKAY